MRQVKNHFALTLFDLSVCCELREVFLGDAVLDHHVQGDDANFIVVGNGCVEEDGDDVSHVILDFLAFGIGAHGEVLLNATQFINVALRTRNALAWK